MHLQSSVHASLADRHLQFPLHPFLQEQEISSEEDFKASCKCDQTGMQLPSVSFLQPQSSGFGVSGAGSSNLP